MRSSSAVNLMMSAALLSTPMLSQAQTKAPLYNTAKQKLLEGKQVFSFTQSKFDIPGYCEAAKHYDYAWFEMQHSTLEFKDVEAMIAACPHAGAIPMVRLPDAQEWHIQHATDIGALGVVIPTVDDVERAREAAKMISDEADQGRCVLVFAHGFFNAMLGMELNRLGWRKVWGRGYKYWSTRRFERR